VTNEQAAAQLVVASSRLNLLSRDTTLVLAIVETGWAERYPTHNGGLGVGPFVGMITVPIMVGEKIEAAGTRNHPST